MSTITTLRELDRSLSEMATHHEFVRAVNQVLDDGWLLYRLPRTWLWVYGLEELEH